MPAQICPNVSHYVPPQEEKKVVFTNGCFDIIHAGHIHNLVSSKALGDFLIIGLNSNSSVKMLKGKGRPVNCWKDRAMVLSNLRCVDMVIGFEEETPIQLIKKIKPNVICKGGDYGLDEMIGGDFVLSYGGEVRILPYHEGYSSTKTMERLSKANMK